MTVQRETLLCRYQYDPLDRVMNCAPLNQDGVQRFYRKNRLATEIQGPGRYSVFEHDSQLMAQQQREAVRVDCALLATDLQRSVVHTVAVGEHQRPVYAPYGHRSPESGLSSLLGFNGERRDPVTGHYLLGNGYRAFNPVLMRFNSPDSLSPFGKGGVNAYAYCLGDPVNMVDPMGEFAMFARGVSQLTSAAHSASRQIGKGLSAMKKSVIGRLNKAPKSPRPGHGPLTTIESGWQGLTKTVPKKQSAQVKEAMARANELNLYDVGAKYQRAALPIAINEPRAAQLQRIAKAKQFPEVIKYNFPADYPKSLSEFQLADRNLGNAVLDHVLQFPGELMQTKSLVALIRRV